MAFQADVDIVVNTGCKDNLLMDIQCLASNWYAHFIYINLALSPLCDCNLLKDIAFAVVMTVPVSFFTIVSIRVDNGTTIKQISDELALDGGHGWHIEVFCKTLAVVKQLVQRYVRAKTLSEIK